MRKILLLLVVCISVAAAVLAMGWPSRSASVSSVAPPPTPNHMGGLVARSPALAAATKSVPVTSRVRPKSKKQTSKPRHASRSKSIRASKPKLPAGPYLVLIVLDGARPDYFSVSGIPHVRALMRSGTQYSQAFAGILESETPSGHATLATGSPPRNDGILSFDWATSDNTVIDLFDPNKVRGGAMERVMSQTGTPTIASIVHKSDPKAKVVALGGHKYYANDAIGGPQADAIIYYSGTPDGKFAPTAIPGHVPPKGVLDAPGLVYKSTHVPVGYEDHLAVKLQLAAFKRMHQRVTLINLPEFDWPLGHVDGGNRDWRTVQTLMRGFDHDLAILENAYRKAGILNRTEFVITADHGFAPIYHTINDNDIRKAVTAARTSIISEAYHTGAFLWVKNESRAAAAAAKIAALRNPYIQSVYFKEARGRSFRYVRASGPDLFRARGMEAANQALLQSFTGPNGPDIVVFFAEEAGSEPGGQAQWKGDHGGGDWESQHIPLIFAGPGVRRGYVSSYPARLMDIAPTALALLGMPRGAMQGLPLADAMQSPPQWAVGAQRQQSKWLWPVVASLQWESRLEVKARR